MYKILITIFIIILCFPTITALAATAEAVSSNDLIDKAKDYDGQKVSYTGEVIGDIMDRGEYSWVNVSDGANAIGTWVKTSDMQNVTIAGRYGYHGDTIKINGVFHRACAEHGGDFDIHAEKIEVSQKGYAVGHSFTIIKIIISSVLFSAAIICMVLIFKKREPRLSGRS